MAWSPAHVLLLLGSIASATVELARLAATLGVGGTTELDILRIDDALEPTMARWRVARLSTAGWELGSLDGSESRHVQLGPSGRPMLPDAADWPLEV